MRETTTDAAPAFAVHRHPSALLLVAQLVAIVCYPFLETSRWGSATLGVISMVAVALAMRVVRSTPALTVIAVVFGLPAVAMTLCEAIWPDQDGFTLASAFLHAPFYVYVAYSTIRYLFHDIRVTPDELYAIGSTFTVIAWAFAYAYEAVVILVPGAVQPESALGHGSSPFFALLFFSFTNLTSVGLSDLLPTSPYIRSVVMLEQVAGVLYVAMVISRLVTLSVRSRE